MMSDQAFTLHPQLAADCVVLDEWPLCQVLLMNDRNYPWLILVPQREGLKELIDLAPEDYQQFWLESAQLSLLIEDMFHPDKLNVAALGNVVSQLHVHHIGRFEDDNAWPAPVWGVAPAEPYTTDEIEKIKEAFLDRM